MLSLRCLISGVTTDLLPYRPGYSFDYYFSSTYLLTVSLITFPVHTFPVHSHTVYSITRCPSVILIDDFCASINRQSHK